MTQASNAVQRRLAKILRERKEPHGKSFKDKEILKGVEVNESGIAELWVKPTHPYCPCCINDLIELRKQIISYKRNFGLSYRRLFQYHKRKGGLQL